MNTSPPRNRSTFLFSRCRCPLSPSNPVALSRGGRLEPWHCFRSVMVHSRARITIRVGPTLGASFVPVKHVIEACYAGQFTALSRFFVKTVIGPAGPCAVGRCPLSPSHNTHTRTHTHTTHIYTPTYSLTHSHTHTHIVLSRGGRLEPWQCFQSVLLHSRARITIRIGPALGASETTQGRMDGFFSQLPFKCFLPEVASVGD